LPRVRGLHVLLAASLLAACATRADPIETGSAPADTTAPGGLDTPVSPQTEAGGDAPTSEEIILAALADVESFWAATYPEVYDAPYEPIAGGFWGYGPDTELPPCGEPGLTYDDVEGNAFYCGPGDLIAWDEVALTPQLYEEFGGFTLAIVMAHEFGHAIQARAGAFSPGIVAELQADCFAGAWTGAVEAGMAPSFELTLDDLDRAVAGFLELRDGIGVAAQDPLAHGTGFDRIGAFQEGFELGAAHCVEYPDMAERGELIVVEVPFTDPEDFERGGDLPLAEVFPLALEDLDNFWEVLFRELGEVWEPVSDVVVLDATTDSVECGTGSFAGDDLDGASFYCAPDDVIYIDHTSVIEPLYEIGDYAVATELARLHAYAAQERLGESENTLESNLAADCYAGIYASSGFLGNRGEDQRLFLSPGDLDEAVIAFLRTSDSGTTIESGGGTVGSAFQRFGAFRSGFTDGLDACGGL
jgi:predicted metalloprotease